jgi:transcriptional regulator with XRE-family HTH domain
MSNIKPYNSNIIDSILADIKPGLQKQIEYRMKLAAKIDKARIKMGLSKKQIAEKLSKRPSEITKWLSGTHNFTSDTLFDIQQLLAVELLNIEDKSMEVTWQYSIEVTQEELTPSPEYGFSRLNDYSDLLYKSSAIKASIPGLYNLKIVAEA